MAAIRDKSGMSEQRETPRSYLTDELTVNPRPINTTAGPWAPLFVRQDGPLVVRHRCCLFVRSGL